MIDMTGPRSGRLIAIILTATFAAYFPAAYWSRQTYVPLPEPNGAIIHLQSFQRSGPPDTFGYLGVAQSVQKGADTPEAPQRSRYIIYEDEKPLARHTVRKRISKGSGSGGSCTGVKFLFSPRATTPTRASMAATIGLSCLPGRSRR
jgi:hypothetical protein